MIVCWEIWESDGVRQLCSLSILIMLCILLQIKVAESAALPFVLHRGGVIEAVTVRATPQYRPADSEPRFTDVAIRRVCRLS